MRSFISKVITYLGVYFVGVGLSMYEAVASALRAGLELSDSFVDVLLEGLMEWGILRRNQVNPLRSVLTFDYYRIFPDLNYLK